MGASRARDMRTNKLLVQCFALAVVLAAASAASPKASSLSRGVENFLSPGRGVLIGAPTQDMAGVDNFLSLDGDEEENNAMLDASDKKKLETFKVQLEDAKSKIQATQKALRDDLERQQEAVQDAQRTQRRAEEETKELGVLVHELGEMAQEMAQDNGASCKDSAPYCADLRQEGFCDTRKFPQYSNDASKCQKTCGTCREENNARLDASDKKKLETFKVQLEDAKSTFQAGLKKLREEL